MFPTSDQAGSDATEKSPAATATLPLAAPNEPGPDPVVVAAATRLLLTASGSPASPALRDVCERILALVGTAQPVPPLATTPRPTNPERAGFDAVAAGVAGGLPVPTRLSYTRHVGVLPDSTRLSFTRHVGVQIQLADDDTTGVDRWAAYFRLPAPQNLGRPFPHGRLVDTYQTAGRVAGLHVTVSSLVGVATTKPRGRGTR